MLHIQTRRDKPTQSAKIADVFSLVHRLYPRERRRLSPVNSVRSNCQIPQTLFNYPPHTPNVIFGKGFLNNYFWAQRDDVLVSGPCQNLPKGEPFPRNLSSFCQPPHRISSGKGPDEARGGYLLQQGLVFPASSPGRAPCLSSPRRMTMAPEDYPQKHWGRPFLKNPGSVDRLQGDNDHQLAKNPLQPSHGTYPGNEVGQGQVDPKKAKLRHLGDPAPTTRKALRRFGYGEVSTRRFCPTRGRTVPSPAH
ncbi:hypothetical protein GWK47_031485 [Chionoecetes opilio]|uniref:Uncharacterized protein n=1 Tax=Chionoecetes opilio TaxID=41210 RepID=A0A8J4Z0X0_CHIOP|nr:hypothetical protein GWK47_031485 [Chionoecetes opilio]